MNRNLLLGILTFGVIVLVYQGCGKESLRKLDNASVGIYDYVDVKVNFCTSSPLPAKQNVKYLFILDHSSSNKPNVPNIYDPNDITDTDPMGVRRYGQLINFVENLVPDANNPAAFGLINFNSRAAQIDGLSGFETDANRFVELVTGDWIGPDGNSNNPSPDDQGFTDYKAALTLAKQIISDDATMAAASPGSLATNYILIFVSDGVPVISLRGASYTETFSTDISPLIEDILNFKNSPVLGPFISNISMNTAYYYNSVSIPAAVTLMQQMATLGNGQYVEFSSGVNVLYQNFTPPSRRIKNQLADIFVQNTNAVWWEDGRFMLDSDSDGLPDDVENQLGSNPLKKDSDGNGVSDFVEYKTKGKPCTGPTCEIGQRNSYSICAGYNPSIDNFGDTHFSSSANDGLNDCEKFLLGANINSFNTNNNFIPDNYAIINSLAIVPGSGNGAFTDPFGDGLQNYQKLKLGLPLSISAKSLTNFKERKLSLVEETSNTPTVECYTYKADHVALTAPNNKIQVMLVENTSLILNKPYLRTALKQVIVKDDPIQKLEFYKEDFK